LLACTCRTPLGLPKKSVVKDLFSRLKISRVDERPPETIRRTRPACGG